MRGSLNHFQLVNPLPGGREVVSPSPTREEVKMDLLVERRVSPCGTRSKNQWMRLKKEMVKSESKCVKLPDLIGQLGVKKGREPIIAFQYHHQIQSHQKLLTIMLSLTRHNCVRNYVVLFWCSTMALNSRTWCSMYYVCSGYLDGTRSCSHCFNEGSEFSFEPIMKNIPPKPP